MYDVLAVILFTKNVSFYRHNPLFGHSAPDSQQVSVLVNFFRLFAIFLLFSSFLQIATFFPAADMKGPSKQRVYTSPLH